MSMSGTLSTKITEEHIEDELLWKLDESNVCEIADLLSDGLYNYMFDCSYSPNGKYLVVGCYDGCVHIIDTENYNLIYSLKNHSAAICSICFSQDGLMLATSSIDKTILIYNLPDFSVFTRLSNNAFIFGVCFSHCENYIYCSDDNGNLKKFKISSRTIVLQAKLHDEGIWRFKLSGCGKYILTGSIDNTAKLIDANNFFVLNTFQHDDCIYAVDFHPSKGIIAVGDISNKVKLWNIDNGLLIHTIDMKSEVRALQFLNSVVLLVMSADGFITSIDWVNLQQIQKIHCGCDNVFYSFAISPDMTQLACGRCTNNTIKVYSILHSCEHPSFE
eukprot:TRINITY_DN9271_c0_g1_i1.p1 TRINITY_DN9271_c0_g1~~TRINITY_DN9271_c0_g1_i1.p1  ORF type:complete len:331 (+),score=60.55 TRINITY_DN9271_c0_g1_i1:154-1146(+)